jgi:hypothetical protein
LKSRIHIPDGTSRLKPFLIFLTHQFISTLGMGFLAVYLDYGILDLFHMIGRSGPRYLYTVWAYRPYFPIQVALGIYSGWLIGRRWRRRSMLWVWVIPLLILGYAMIAVPTLIPGTISVMAQAGASQSAFSHYLGWGCQPKDGCFDQTLVTLPFYTSIAYSRGAWMARFTPSKQTAPAQPDTKQSTCQGN